MIECCLRSEMISKLTIFSHCCRPLSSMEFERILQDWTAGKESGVWLSVDVVLQCCREIEKQDIDKYLSLERDSTLFSEDSIIIFPAESWIQSSFLTGSRHS